MIDVPRPRRFSLGITFAILVLLVTVIFCRDPVNRLRLEFLFQNLTGASWQNGLWHVQKMPPAATPEQAAGAYYAEANYATGPVSIRRKEPLGWPDSGECTVICIEGAKGSSMLVMKPAFGGWAVREY